MLDAAAVEPTAAGSELHQSEQSSCVAVLKSGTGMGSARAQVASLRAYSCDAVVFCLLLSYMPTPALRLEACRRARALLRPSGLLLIVTPDSSHVGKAAARMKRWRASIEALGFRRWRCVAFSFLLFFFWFSNGSTISHLLSSGFLFVGVSFLTVLDWIA